MIEVGIPQDLSELIRDSILDIGSFQIGESVSEEDRDFANLTRFASGAEANNKLIADLLLASNDDYSLAVPERRRASRVEVLLLRHLVLTQYDNLLDNYHTKPDTLWGVPSGGQDYAVRRAKRMGLQVVRLAKVDVTPGQKTFMPATPEDAEILANAKYMVASEDAGSEGSSPYGAIFNSDEYGLEALREKTIGIDYIWVRGKLTRIINRLSVQTLVHEPIPTQISRQDRFFQRFGHLAVESQAQQ